MTGKVWGSILVAIKGIVFGEARRRRSRAANKRAVARGAEQLESRHLLATNPISFVAASSSVIVQGTAEMDNVQVWSDATKVHVSMTTGTEVSMSSFDKSSVALVRFIGGEGDDRFDNFTNIATRVYGDGGSDRLSSGGGNDKLYGGAGDDILVGGDGIDELYGEAGNDNLSGSGGVDRLEGGAGTDLLHGGADDDTLIGGDGNDTLFGESGNDRLYGQNGADRLEGDDGSDTLYGGADDDSLHGDEGDDLLYGEDGSDRLYGSIGVDRLEGGTGDDRLEGGSHDDTLIGGDGDDEAWGDGGNDRIFGNNGNDKLIGRAGDDLIYGGADNDMLVGSEGDDELYGDAGSDRLFGQTGADRLDGGTEDDWMDGGDHDDSLFGGDGVDDMYGQDGSDRLMGNNGKDTLVGGDGDDYLSGGADNDTLVGNAGADEVYGDAGNDRLHGDAGEDRMDGGADHDWMDGGDGDDVLGGGDGNDDIYAGAGSDRLTGGNGNDRLNAGVGNGKLFGGAGDDQLIGGSGDDSLEGEDGNDSLWGNSGADVLNGGIGVDRLEGGNGDDTLSGGEGDDRLRGDAGSDRLFGNAGNDDLGGGLGNDVMYGNSGADSLAGGDGNDDLYGDDGDDELLGEAGDDSLNGDAGNEVLVGGDGDDELWGGLGNDVLLAGGGTDLLYGQGDDDLLIGGSTEYDADRAALRALVLAWSAATPYSMRVAQIASEGFSAHLISTETVFEDGVADELFGGDGQDWFFQTGALEAYVPQDVHAHAHAEAPADGHGSQQHAGPVVIDHLPLVEGFELISAIDDVVDRQATETLHTLLPHSENAAMQREHLSLFELVRYDEITHYALHDGAWADPATWHDGLVPGDGAHVLIPLGVEVEVNSVVTSRLTTIRVDGTLSFNRAQNTELRADTVVVSSNGAFEMGTEDSPIMPGVRARLVILDNGPIDRIADPFAMGRGLISHGAVSIVGAQVSSYAALAGAELRGATRLELKQMPIGWKPGDTIVVAGTIGGTTQNEVRKILGMNGSTVVLNAPLSFDHVAPSSVFEVHVANVTRNAVIESESTVIQERGHVMFMHSPNVHIAYGGFYKLGRTDKLQVLDDSVVNDDFVLQAGTGTNPRARYPVHFHRAGTSYDDPAAVVMGSAVVDSPGWGFVNHSSHVDMLNNVAFDVQGASFATEVGDEIGSFRGNIAIGTRGSGESINNRIGQQDFGHQGDGFWFQGGGVSVTGNISAGNDQHAFVYYTRGLIETIGKGMFRTENLPDPSIANGAETIDVTNVPILQFEHNIGYASSIGIAVRYQLLGADHPLRSVLENSVFWNNVMGINLSYSGKIILRDLTVAYAPGTWPEVGIQENSLTRDVVYENLTVTGYEWGINLARTGSTVVDGGYYDNRIDLVVESALGPNRTVLVTGAIQFGSTLTTGRTHVLLRPTLDGYSGDYQYLLQPDVVILDYGLYQNRRVYSSLQLATAIPFPGAIEGLPSGYVGRTNQQLWNQFHVAWGGAIAPSTTVTLPFIMGLVAP